MIKSELKRGIIDQNPVFRLGLGLCPALAVTATVNDAMVMGICVWGVLIASAAAVSLTRKLIPQRMQAPCHIMIVACFATMAEIILRAHAPAMSGRLGIYVPLIAVNCLILDRAGSFASQNGFFASILDGAVMGAGFIAALFLCSVTREFLGSYRLFGQQIVPGAHPILAFSSACGGFFAIALVLGLINYLRLRKGKGAP
jgi:Na+-translocating ferredoxin:NAD+ oxidoreductase subunit E